MHESLIGLEQYEGE